MGHFSIVTFDHDRLHEALDSDDLRNRLSNTIQGTGTFHGIPSLEDRRALERTRETLPGVQLAYTAHADTCPVLAFSHGYIKGVVGELRIPRYDDKTIDDYLVKVAKERGFVIYKKPS